MTNRRILIAEDFAPFREFVVSTLKQRAEFQVVGQCSDGWEAVERAEQLQPDLILLDIGLPTLNGFEVAHRTRKLCPNSRILFLTQESSPDVVEDALNLGALGYVVKAHAGNELLEAVEAVVQGKQFVSRCLRPYLPSNEPPRQPEPTLSR
ncbi:MAG TPA: response regulator transcription factor [Candidatus Cybelea sp.]|nr:response regulator transcription factor [Candidatus Cybelea sp.]